MGVRRDSTNLRALFIDCQVVEIASIATQNWSVAKEHKNCDSIGIDWSNTFEGEMIPLRFRPQGRPYSVIAAQAVFAARVGSNL